MYKDQNDLMFLHPLESFVVPLVREDRQAGYKLHTLRFQQRFSKLTIVNHCFFNSDLGTSEHGNSKKQHFSDSDPWKKSSGLAISEPGKKQRVLSSTIQIHEEDSKALVNSSIQFKLHLVHVKVMYKLYILYLYSVTMPAAQQQVQHSTCSTVRCMLGCNLYCTKYTSDLVKHVFADQLKMLHFFHDSAGSGRRLRGLPSLPGG